MHTYKHTNEYSVKPESFGKNVNLSLTFPVEVVLQNGHTLSHLAEQEDTVTTSFEFWKNAVQHLHLPSNTVEFRAAMKGGTQPSDSGGG